MENVNDIVKLCDTVRETGFAIHRFLRSGHLEKIYENALIHRLTKIGIDVKSQHPLSVIDEDGTILGQFFADLFLNSQLIVEVKACKAPADEHVAQLLGYLRASRLEHGLLVNFGAQKFEIKKFILSDCSSEQVVEKLNTERTDSAFAHFAPLRG
jgi:GxxExxY protein